MPYPNIAHKPQVSGAVRELRLTLRLTQQAAAEKFKTALTTWARWETVRSPRGRTLNELARMAKECGRNDLAAVFEKELMHELGLALRSQFRYAVRHQRQALSGELALNTMLEELRRISNVLNEPGVKRDEDIQARRQLAELVSKFEALLAAARSNPVGAKRTKGQD